MTERTFNILALLLVFFADIGLIVAIQLLRKDLKGMRRDASKALAVSVGINLLLQAVQFVRRTTKENETD